jgi:Rha family phage regulatory protein
MAIESIPTVTPVVQIDFLPDGTTPTISSLQLAEHFGIRHRDVLRDIRAITRKTPETFAERNFAPSEYVDTTGRILPCYNLTRDGFTLLAMGYNSARAIQWKLRYIEAFNALERAALDNAREEARLEGGQNALALAAQAYDRITPERMDKVRKAVYYKGKDLSERDIAKLLECSRRSVTNYLQDAKTFGLGV